MLTWLVLLLSGAAFAGDADYYFEGPAMDSRRDATKMSRVAEDMGLQSRVVRRFARGSGWRFVLIVEGFDAETSATEAALSVASDVGSSMVVYQVGDGQATRVAEVLPAEGVEPQPGAGGTEVVVEDVLERAVVAHGGNPHPVRATDTLLFQFTRELPSGLRAEHTVARRGQETYVEVDIKRGEGKSSKAWILDGGAWLSVEGGEPEPQDATWAREQLHTFLPEAVLGLPVGMGEALDTRRELRELYADGTARSGDVQCLVLKYDGDQVSAPLGLFLDEGSLLIRRVVSGVDARNYDDYRSVRSGVMAPFDVQVTQEGEMVDHIQVQNLDLDPELDEAWFSVE